MMPINPLINGESAPASKKRGADESVDATTLMTNFRNRLKTVAALDSTGVQDANMLKLMNNEFQLLATTDGLYVEPEFVDQLKQKLSDLDPKVFEKISRRSRLVKQDEEALDSVKSVRILQLIHQQRQKEVCLDALHSGGQVPLMSPRKRRRLDEMNLNGELIASVVPAPNYQAATAAAAAPADDDWATGDDSRLGSVREESDSDVSHGTTLKLNLNEPRLTVKEQRALTRQYDNTYISIWKDLSRKDGPKAYRLFQQSLQAKQINTRKTCQLAARESKRWRAKTTKSIKDQTTKARRSMREMMNFWKKNEREEKAQRQKAEQEMMAKARKEEEQREAKRQARKLNFLINQTELYSHFIGKKIQADTGGDDDDVTASDSAGSAQKDSLIGAKFESIDPTELAGSKRDFKDLDFDAENEEELQRTAAANAQSALLEAKQKAEAFNLGVKKPTASDDDESGDFQNPSGVEMSIEPPKMLDCTLKEYQKKGLNWLASLYEQGINGILADEMGLGKTVQSISVLAYLAERHDIWGPFLVVTPASTLHNWQQEITKFVPDFKVLPYWGTAKDRKVLRKFWDRKSIVYHKDSPFHVVVTSYQLVVADQQYFQKMKWQYMILDEAQAIKSSASSRWKSLLSFQCRNRLLLTGTPIQNNMQELWALLHFIMPSLFDSHDEFSEWFSKDIESHAQAHTQLDQLQLGRLHAILKPFMLRRIKKNVQSELGEKIEIDVYCELTNRQKRLYRMLRSQINLMDLIERSKKIGHRSSSSKNADYDDENQDSLMNVVMQFRKVCNHPDLFERADTKSAFICGQFAETASLIREANENLLELNYTTKNPIKLSVPRIVYEMSEEVKKLERRDSDVWAPENIQTSPALACLRLMDESAGEAAQLATHNLIQRAVQLRSYTEDQPFEHQKRQVDVYGKPLKKSLALSPADSIMEELTSVPRQQFLQMYLADKDRCAFDYCRAPPVDVLCSSQRFHQQHHDRLFDAEFRQALYPLSLDTQWDLYKHEVPMEMWPKAEMMPRLLSSDDSFSTIRLPSMERFVLDSGKLKKLDQMLPELKKGGHKCLVYFQMTRMMDLMEEYLTYRQYKYIRLDGSSRLSDRRDLVNDWQTRPDLFIFLLSTRAGGLGINLTAADTVIFYDSDWNPTIDSQAMDRAHRLGQTRQVTVYRLMVKGTIEERMRDRAKQKEQVQKVVMGGEEPEEITTTTKADDKKEMAMWLLEDS